VVLVPFEVVDQPGRPGALLLQPLQLVLRRVRLVEDAVGQAIEGGKVPRAGRREAAHGDAAEPIRAFGILVRPRDVVPGAGRQHVHLVAGGHALGDEAAVILGAAHDFRAITLDDERDSHDVTVSNMRCTSGSTRARSKSRTRRR